MAGVEDNKFIASAARLVFLSDRELLRRKGFRGLCGGEWGLCWLCCLRCLLDAKRPYSSILNLFLNIASKKVFCHVLVVFDGVWHIQLLPGSCGTPHTSTVVPVGCLPAPPWPPLDQASLEVTGLGPIRVLPAPTVVYPYTLLQPCILCLHWWFVSCFYSIECLYFSLMADLRVLSVNNSYPHMRSKYRKIFVIELEMRSEVWSQCEERQFGD